MKRTPPRRKRVVKKPRGRKKPARRIRITRIIQRKRIVKRKPPKRKPPKPPKPPRSVEYSVNVSYKNKSRPAGAISLQFSVVGPPNLTKDEVIDVITETIISEGDTPKGFKVRIVSWKNGRVPRDVPWGSLAIISGEPATRFSVQRSGRD